jgi:glycosyltransferase 2 family protein
VNESLPSATQTRRATIIGVAVGVPASLAFLWLAFRDASLDAVWAVAREAKTGYVALAVALIAALYVLQALRWRLIARSHRPGLVRFVEMAIGGVACNNVLPGRVGELFRARWLAVAAPMASGRALASVGLDRGTDAVVLFGFLVVSLPFVLEAAWTMPVLGGTAVMLVVGLAGLVLVRRYARQRQRGRRERSRLRQLTRDVVDALAEPLGRRRVLEVLGLGSLAWALFAIAVWLVARAVGVELEPFECVFVTGVINLGVAIPSSPGFIGTYQWLAVASLGLFGVAPEDALAISLLLHASWYVPTTIVGGAFVLFRLRLRRDPG